MSWIAGASTRKEGDGGAGRSLLDGAGEGVRERWKLKCDPDVRCVGVGGGCRCEAGASVLLADTDYAMEGLNGTLLSNNGDGGAECPLKFVVVGDGVGS